MEANEAPEKIYLQVCGDCQDNECDNCKFEDLEDNVTWCKDKIFDKDIEYIRTDAFIEKATKWLNDHIINYMEFDEYSEMLCGFDEDRMIEDFKNYMKGE